ncbi:hypothetical protein [Cerasicoccus arenae]|uniref:PEP-CTERM sorting domain-containing protein n=1 Tax=Cerasicoccus arenae TaxID=424488 RepID=A0A8J3DF08_9BACT|nr:hypothetical protein [Cerasicoccus arenae]MBK1859288.1 hypothetical protein [Cerasicoccus arenae]GHC13345.1 hypothetical protein GCM10007047_33350 [Cerasicoccus arenae]
MKYTKLISSTCLLASISALHGQISLTDAGYTQDFNATGTFSLSYGTGSHTWTDNSTIPGWYAATDSPNNGNYRASNGRGQSPTSVTPNSSLFAFRTGTGIDGNDGALGSIADGTHHAVIGVQFTNNTASAINGLDISYTGEQWAWNSSSDLNSLNFAYSTDATSLSTGVWTDVSLLNFTALYSGGSGEALNGNSDEIFENGTGYVAKTAGQAGGPGATNFTNIGSTLTGLSIAPGETFWFRWTDNFNDEGFSGVGQGIAIDNFSVGVIPEFSSVALSLGGVALALCFLRRRTR